MDRNTITISGSDAEVSCSGFARSVQVKSDTSTKDGSTPVSCTSELTSTQDGSTRVLRLTEVTETVLGPLQWGGGGGLNFSVRGTPTRALEGNLLTLSRRSSSCHPRSSSPSYPLRSSAWHRTATQTPGVGAQNPHPHPHPTPSEKQLSGMMKRTGGFEGVLP